MTLILLILAALAVWLVATWYFADDEPALGPASDKRVTFKKVVQNAVRDVREICAPVVGLARRIWVWGAPKLTNPTTWAALVTNGALFWPQIVADPGAQEFLARHPWLYMAGAFVALVATRNAAAPTRIPAPSFGGGALVNPASIA